jgi:hypothetical protein
MERRAFVVDLWAERSHIALGSTDDLELAAQVLGAWHDPTYTTMDVLKRFAFLKVSAVGHGYLTGHEVDFWWDYLASDSDIVASAPRLGSLLAATRRQPKLRHLRPFTSHYDLGFSRVTRYPFDVVAYIRTHSTTAEAEQSADLRYEVFDRWQLFGDEGAMSAFTPQEAAALAADLVPDCCGPALEGTADDQPTDAE